MNEHRFSQGDTVANWNRTKEGVVVRDYGDGRYFIRWDNGCQNPATDAELRRVIGGRR